jgi:glucose-inhibited division protein A
MKKSFDAIIIGAGHAGCEAAYALSKLGKETLLVCVSLDSIAFMACNPNIGGVAKAHLVKEIDALGGIMGRIADRATIQTRLLNSGSGPAVQSLRNQVDKALYHRLMKSEMENAENLTILQGEAVEILTEGNKVIGISTALGDEYEARAVVIATGVYLNAKVITGEYTRESGPNGLMRSSALASSLLKLGLPLRRFKTGTPPRVLGRSVDYSKTTPQPGEKNLPKFSALTDGEPRNDYACYLTYTNEKTHKIILENLKRAPLYNGSISGIGPRYCPSIEVKVVLFKDKARHQIFIEPEGAETDEVYVQGMSTSLPFDVQERMLETIPGLENAIITRYGYAIEYDCLDPLALYPSLAVKNFEGLFAAGQFNGSSGYEEAAAQGLIAGINASLFLDGKEPFILRRDEAYIGVLIDDLTTAGTPEPYRLMTSRAEHRLYLRQDNADIRLTEKGISLGMVGGERLERYNRRLAEIERLKKLLKTSYSPAAVAALIEFSGAAPPKSGISAKELLRRPEVNSEALIKFLPEFRDAGLGELKYLETEIKYEGYLVKENRAVKEAARLESRAVPKDLDYINMSGLRIEARQKLDKIKPLTLAQAARISGVTPADIAVLMLYLKAK